MAVTTTDDLKVGSKPAKSDAPKAEAPKVQAADAPGGNNPEFQSVQKHIEGQSTVEVYIPKARGTQRVQINGVDFFVPAGVKVEVAEDIHALLKGSGALDLPPEV